MVSGGLQDRTLDTQGTRVDAVFVFSYPSRADTFRFPAIFACCSGEMKARGFNTLVAELFLDEADGLSAAALSSFCDMIALASPSVVVLSDVFEPAVVDAIRGVFDGELVCTDQRDPEPEGPIDWVVERFETNPLPLVELVTALVRGLPVDGIPNVRAASAISPTRLEPCATVPMFTAVPDYGFLAFPPGTRRPSERLSVYVNPGCPWASSVASNPAYEGADLVGPELSLRGCGFCLQDGRYSGLDAGATVDRVLFELRAWVGIHPECKEVVIWDESPWRFLPLLVERIADELNVPLAVCFHSRVDDLLRHSATIEKACAAARRKADSGVTLAVTLIGFENYSNAELARMNKGVTDVELSAAAAECRRIADAWPDVFEFDRFQTSSFILFTPWTSASDLRENVAGFRRDGILDFATGMGLTKLRLYPGLPIFRLALRDGLVSHAPLASGMDSARRFGYSTDVPFRFRTPSVEHVYRLNAVLFPMVERNEQVDLLDWVVRSVFEGDAADASPDEFAALFMRLKRVLDSLNSVYRSVEPQHEAASVRRSDGNELDTGRANAERRTLEIVLSGHGVPGAQTQPDLRLDPSPGRLAVRIARHGACASMVHVIGREPCVSPVFLRSVYLSRQSGIPRAAVRTCGFVFAEPALVAKAIKAGLTDIEFRFFGLEADAWSSVTGNTDGYRLFEKAAGLVGASRSLIRSRALIELGLVAPHLAGNAARMAMDSGLSGVSWEAPPAYLPVRGLATFVGELEAFLDSRIRSSREHP